MLFQYLNDFKDMDLSISFYQFFQKIMPFLKSKEEEYAEHE
jgi:hypothetical protein